MRKIIHFFLASATFVEAQLRADLAEWEGRTPEDGKKALSAVPVETKNQSRKPKK